jgi:hypothetical protein
MKSAMDALSDPLDGWTIAEAIRRTSDSDNLVYLVDKNPRAATPQTVLLRDRLLAGQLVAVGSFESQTVLPVPIDPQILLTLDWSECLSSTLNGAAGSDIRIFNFRVFPVLRAPNAANHLDGLSLAEAFQKYVLNDPEVVTSAKNLMKTEPRHSAVFIDGQAPGPFLDFHWPLDLSASAMAFRFIASLIYFMDDPLPEPSAALSAISEVLADRIGKLRDMLAGGKIVAFGTFVQTGIEGPIARLQWVRGDISIEISNGDLCEGSDHRAVPKWTGLSLQVASKASSANQSQNSDAPKVVETVRETLPQIQTKEKCRLECVTWLKDTIQANPTEKIPKEELWGLAQRKWPRKLSRRAFETARTEAINETRALAWTEAGRPKRKSPHS